jgi:predicted ATPase with chaperone activity
MPGKKITINMAPADLRKGSAYDLTTIDFGGFRPNQSRGC